MVTLMQGDHKFFLVALPIATALYFAFYFFRRRGK
jgi:hypothetical protein